MNLIDPIFLLTIYVAGAIGFAIQEREWAYATLWPLWFFMALGVWTSRTLHGWPRADLAADLAERAAADEGEGT